MRSAFRERNDMVDFLRLDVSLVCKAHLTERMPTYISVTDSFPGSAVAFAGGVTALELLVVPLHYFFMFLAVNAVR